MKYFPLVRDNSESLVTKILSLFMRSSSSSRSCADCFKRWSFLDKRCASSGFVKSCLRKYLKNLSKEPNDNKKIDPPKPRAAFKNNLLSLSILIFCSKRICERELFQ